MRFDIFRANPPWTSSKFLCANHYTTTTTTHGGPTPMDKDGIIELSVKASCLHPVFGPPFTHYPLFQCYPQSNEILSNLSMKCWNSGFNAKGSMVIITYEQGSETNPKYTCPTWIFALWYIYMCPFKFPWACTSAFTWCQEINELLDQTKKLEFVHGCMLQQWIVFIDILSCNLTVPSPYTHNKYMQFIG
jgi:hypothetical protein